MALNGEQLDVVRQQVKGLLGQSASFAGMDAPERRRLANDFVKVVSALAAPAAAGEPPADALLSSTTLANAAERTAARLAEKPGSVTNEFKAGAMREGTEAFGELVKKVDFPAFVSGLVNGVFQAVVNASIQQMEAYAQLLGAVVKSVDEFAAENISEGQARDYLASRFPDQVQVDTSREKARLVPASGADSTDRISREMGLPKARVDDEQGEAQLVAAARREMAKSRQQTLATMVLMGINRIVVTDGRINAKVLFDVETSDVSKRKATASMHDEKSSKTKSSASVGGALGWIGGGASVSNTSEHKTTVSSAIDDRSESSAKMKAQLSGEVRLSFRSETFPLEKMVDVMGMQTIQSRGQSVVSTPQAPASPTPTPPART